MIDFGSGLWIIRVQLADTNKDNRSQLWSLTAKRTGCDTCESRPYDSDKL